MRKVDEALGMSGENVIARWSKGLRASTALGRLSPKAFARDEDGSGTLQFALALFICMLMVAGLAVDVAIYEDNRARLQQTADRAVLAAADLDQELDPTDVVNDYFEAAGLGDSVSQVTVDDGLNYRRVVAETELEVNTYFSHMFGVTSFTAPALSAAEERKTDVEISLVVDVSGSMGSNNRMRNLKTAAAEFFDAVIKQDGAGLTTVSIIPYNGVVNAGETFLSYMNVNTEHEESHCIRFRDADFDVAEISNTTPLERVAHFDFWTNSYKKPKEKQYWCSEDDSFEMLIHETDAQVMTDYVNDLYTGGWTAINNGVKWGLALLDPAIEPVISQMVDDGHLAGPVKSRPVAYDNDENMKVIVIMTDGANTYERDLHDNYKTGDSGVYYSVNQGGGKGVNEDNNHDGFYVEIPGNSPSQRYYRPRSPSNTGDDQYFSSLPGDAAELTNQDLYVRFALDDAARMMWQNSDWNEFNRRYNDVMNMHDRNGEVDDRTEDICDMAKQDHRKIQVFAIGFEAPSRGQDIMQYCATTPGHYYDISGTDISVAFASIATTINRLRLTQ